MKTYWLVGEERPTLQGSMPHPTSTDGRTSRFAQGSMARLKRSSLARRRRADLTKNSSLPSVNFKQPILMQLDRHAVEVIKLSFPPLVLGLH